MTTDIRIHLAFIPSIVPLTQRGTEWVHANVEAESWQWQGGELIVDGAGFALDIADGAREDGLSVECH